MSIPILPAWVDGKYCIPRNWFQSWGYGPYGRLVPPGFHGAQDTDVPPIPCACGGQMTYKGSLYGEITDQLDPRYPGGYHWAGYHWAGFRCDACGREYTDGY